MKQLVILFALFALATSCKSVKIGGDEKGVIATIERGSCFGKCPVYVMEIYKDGKVLYEGKRYTKKVGIYRKNIEMKEVKAIAKAFGTEKFMTFDDEYSSDIQDLPSVTISYHDGTTRKRVIGKDRKPGGFIKLQSMLEKLADSDDWATIRAGEDTNELEERIKTEKIIYSEIIIEAQNGTLPAFLQAMADKSVSLKDRVTADNRLWLITYDTALYKSTEMIEMIRKDPRIISAEFNKVLSER
jgi:hypothetical protein